MITEGDPSLCVSVKEGGESLDVPLISGGGLFGFVMVIADLATDLAAIALARARWCTDREDRTI